MTDRYICPLLCPMINKYGFCESAMRRVGQVRECPHKRMRRGMSKLDTPPKAQK